jgi:hypothetical protein
MKEVRVIALWRDDPTEARFTLDVRMDAATRRVVSRWDVFGAFDLDGAACRPFVLRRDGVLDFGARGGERWRADVREIELKVGARFTILWNAEDKGEDEVVKLAEIGAKEKLA